MTKTEMIRLLCTKLPIDRMYMTHDELMSLSLRDVREVYEKLKRYIKS